MREIKKIKETMNLFIDQEGYDGFMGRWFNKNDNKMYTFIFSYGGGWEHLSVSLPRKTPSWEVMCRMKDIFWNDDETCVEYHPAKNQYVNNHPHCLHIWRPVNNDQFFNEPESKEEDVLARSICCSSLKVWSLLTLRCSGLSVKL